MDVKYHYECYLCLNTHEILYFDLYYLKFQTTRDEDRLLPLLP